MTTRFSFRPRALRGLCMLLAPLALGLAATASAQAQPYGRDRYDDAGQGIVRCESIRNRSQECRLDGQPRLIRQLSGSPCIEGESWGRSRQGVWVTRGCRAEFVAERRGRPGHGWGGHPGGGNGRGQLVDCDSNDHRQRRCAVDVRRDVRLVRQKSSTPCVEGRSWGWDRRGVWVDGGCRAQFLVN